MNLFSDSRPTTSAIVALLDALGLSGAQFGLHELPGSNSNFTHLLRIQFEDCPPRQVVVRRFNPEYYIDGHDKHICEFYALRLLKEHSVPVPAPLLLDETGEMLGLPGIVTEYVSGMQIKPSTEAARWGEMAATNARMLAQIHLTAYAESDKKFLMNDNVEVARFIKGGAIPDYMRRDPDGEMVWHLVNDHWHRRIPVTARFQHTDYWSGNILWEGDRISAVVDWEEAGYGDPAGDVAYARMEYLLEGLPEAADTFLRVYMAESGWALPNLPLFELAASARPMTDLAGWITRPHIEERFRKFIADAKRKLLAEV